MKKIILISSPEQALYFTGHIAFKEDCHWICFDPRSEKILQDSQISFSTELDYDVKSSDLGFWQEKALALCDRWFVAIPPEKYRSLAAFRIEESYAQIFFYFFVSAFRSNCLIEKVIERYPQCEFHVCEQKLNKNYLESMRLSLENSLLAWILNAYENSAVTVKRHFLEKDFFKDARGGIKENALNFISFLYSKLSPQGAALFCGNPKLLDEIAKSMKMDHGEKVLWIRNAARLRDGLGGYLKLKLPVWLFPQGAVKNNSFNEKEYYYLLQKSEVFNLAGIDFLPAFWPFILHFYRWEVEKGLKAVALLTKVFATLKPKCIVTDEDSTPFGRILVRVAAQNSIPTRLVLHGIPGTSYMAKQLVSDSVFVWGENTKRMFVENGISANRVVISGCPKYDVLAKTNKNRSVKTSSALTVTIIVDTLRSNVFEAFNGIAMNAREIFMMVKTLCAAARRLKDVRFILKMRCSEEDLKDIHETLYRMGGMPPNLKLISKGNAIELMHASDLIITGTSSAFFESILLNKFVAVNNIGCFQVNNMFGEVKGICVLNNDEELISLCLRLSAGKITEELFQNARNEIIHKFLYLNDGKASRRISDSIMKSLEGN